MTREEAIKYLIKPVATSTEIGEEKQKEFEAYDMAIEALTNEETLKTQLANCHKEILRLLDFNNITESPNDVVEPKDDVIEVVYCKDCRHANECHKSVQYTRNEPRTVTMGYSPIEWCSHGERRKP